MAESSSHEKIENLDRTLKSIQEDRPLAENEIATAEPTSVGDSKPSFGGLQKMFDGKYQVLEKIGEGGMSTVYKVRHIHLNKILALKLLHQIKEESVLRFQQEAKASSLLEHPNIVRVHDFGVSNGLPYMTMDYLDGMPLSDFSKNAGPLSLERLMRLFGQICSALAHAHEQGVIHRDLKPSNIIIRTLENGFEQAIVVDYGIAKIIDAAGTPASNSLTRTGDIFGTPFYMSPEQCQGRSVDMRSDIYSLGCVMYESITGNKPFYGNSVYETIHKQITEAPAEFSETVRKTHAGRRLEAVVLKSMAKLPENRQQHVLELSSELKSIELGDGGLWSDWKSFWQIMTGRMKAAERRSLVLQSLLNCSSVLAVMASILLLSMPGLIDANSKELERNKEIIQKIQLCFNNKISTDLKEEHDRLVRRRNIINRLCKNDKKQRAVAAELSKSIRLAMNSSLEVDNTVAKVFQQSAGFNLPTLQAFVTQAKQGTCDTVSLWFRACRIGTELIRICERNIQQSEQYVRIFSFALDSSLVLAPVLLVLIPILTWRRFHALKEAKAAMEIEETAAQFLNTDDRTG